MVIIRNGLKFELSINNTAQCLGFSDKPRLTLEIPTFVAFGKTTYPVTSIAEKAFADCKRLKLVEIPHSIDAINKWAFANCSNLEAVICDSISTFPIKIDQGAFHRCYNLLRFSAKLIHLIGRMVFAECRMLQYFNSSFCGEIPEQSFENCKRLIGIICEDGIQIHNRAFYKCARMDRIVFLGAARIDSKTLPFVLKRKIICKSTDSNLINLAYEGANVVIKP